MVLELYVRMILRRVCLACFRYKHKKATAMFLSIFALSFYVSDLNTKRKADNLIDKIHSSNLKAVQLLTERFRYVNWDVGELGQAPFKDCTEKRCYAFKPYSHRHKPLEGSDAVMVHSWNLFYMPSKLDYKRRKEQIWAYYSMESPHMSFCSFHYAIDELDDWFNMTITYKPSSTFVTDYRPYEFENWAHIHQSSAYMAAFSEFFSNKNAKTINYKRIITEKVVDKSGKGSASVMWFVSNCQSRSRREPYVLEMSQHVEIDIYGECGYFKNSKPDPCSSLGDKKTVEACYLDLFASYKFYLAFENSKCNDYITEKYWKIYRPDYLFNVDIVPVVRGAQQFQYEQIAYEKSSFINADRFESAKDLGVYLAYLNKNHSAYLEHLEWKVHLVTNITAERKRETVQFVQPNKSPFCAVCEKLHDESFMRKEKKPIKMSDWFNPRSECWDEPYPDYIKWLFSRTFGVCV
jgi:hypothetical protein